MALLLARHAWAGSRHEWEGDDRDRPLDERGTAQALGLVELLADLPIERILTSPYRRCVQTVEPLAEARVLAVELHGELGEDHHAGAGEELVRSLAGHDVLVCGHGGLQDVVPGNPVWKKGAVLVLGPELELLEVLRP